MSAHIRGHFTSHHFPWLCLAIDVCNIRQLCTERILDFDRSRKLLAHVAKQVLGLLCVVQAQERRKNLLTILNGNANPIVGDSNVQWLSSQTIKQIAK
jgi:hypothetical protein